MEDEVKHPGTFQEKAAPLLTQTSVPEVESEASHGWFD